MRNLLVPAECVLFDFDGPVCRLFAGRPARGVAAALCAAADRHGADLTPSAPAGPHAVLRAALSHPDGDEVVRSVAEALSAEEWEAAETAWPTAYADRLIRTLHATGHRLAVTTDNAPEAVERYLASRGLGRLLAGHVHGRRPDATRLKPDSDCLLRALESTGTHPDRALMIGDAARDLHAAKSAEVPFLGYARTPAKEIALREAGAEHVTGSLLDVLEIVNVPRFR